MAVRFDKKFLNEINKIIKSYNAKIKRLAKTDSSYVLPRRFGTEEKKDLILSYRSRSEIRRRLKDLKSFIKRGGEKTIAADNTLIPKYQYENIKRYRRLLSYRTTRRMKELETRHPISNGEVDPYTFSQYGSQEYITLKAKRMSLLEKDLSRLTPSEIESYLNKLQANTKKRDLNVWQENYISILEDTALSYGYEPDKLEVIVERLKKLSPTDFDDLSFINRNVREIIYSYKALENIETASELADVSEDVIRNLDSIYNNLDDILKDYE